MNDEREQLSIDIDGDIQGDVRGETPGDGQADTQGSTDQTSEVTSPDAGAASSDDGVATEAEGSAAEGSDAEGSDAEGADDEGDDNPLESEAEIAADYLEELLDIADLDGDIDTYIEGDRAHVVIVSQSEVLVGQDGQVLDALQELTRLAVMTETGDRSRLMLDVAGYRDRRRQELIGLATDAIQSVKDSGHKAPLAAMNPFERKIVHDAVAAAGLRSESEGQEPRRHVVVIPV